MSFKRVLKDLAQIREDESITVRQVMQLKVINEDDLSEIKFSFRGPENTPFESGTFVVKCILRKDYPFKPPQVHFVTKVWHPNISSQTGYVCLDILKTAWRITLNLKIVLISLFELLKVPNGESPQDQIVGRQFLQDPDMYQKTSVMWTHVFAEGSQNVDELASLITKLEEMELGKDNKHRLMELSLNNWQLEQTIGGLVQKHRHRPMSRVTDSDEDDLPDLYLGPQYETLFN